MPGASAPLPTAFPARASRLEALEQRRPDVIVIGGGVTGAGVAHDLTLRGLDVVLVERGDWAGCTSSASSRLIHGGLRYLEQLDIALVRESCLERGLLLRNAAGLVWPERFTFPIHRGAPVGRWKLAAGLWLYTAVSVPRVLGLPHWLGPGAVGEALPGVRSAGLLGGGDYLDGATDDARLTLAVVASAVEAGALALSRMEATAIEAGAQGVTVELREVRTGESRTLEASRVVLAGGPFTDGLRSRARLEGGWVSPTRGAHLLVPRDRLPCDGAVIWNSCVDGRVMFLVPRPRTTLIGTTDLDAAPSEAVRATGEEVRYLLDSANGLVPRAELGEPDVISTYAGLRPLLAGTGADPSARTREERILREGSIYTIAGGKLTGYRAMAEKLGARLADDLGIGSRTRRSPTRAARLRGALERPVERPAWSRLASAASTVEDTLATAWSQRYAALAGAVRDTCASVDGGTEALCPDTLLGEVDWAVRFEDCLRANDFLFRRTDLGLEPIQVARAAAERVVDRLRELRGWSAERATEEYQAARDEIDARSAWRDA